MFKCSLFRERKTELTFNNGSWRLKDEDEKRLNIMSMSTFSNLYFLQDFFFFVLLVESLLSFGDLVVKNAWKNKVARMASKNKQNYWEISALSRIMT